jgi:hypothetical protein
MPKQCLMAKPRASSASKARLSAWQTETTYCSKALQPPLESFVRVDRIP